MKATAVRDDFDMDVVQRPCIVCGTVSRPFGYVNKGNAQVCSKICDERYEHERSHEAVRPVRAVA